MWLQLLPPLLAATGILLLSGAPIAFGLRARGFSFLLLTFPAAFASIGLSSVVAPLLGLEWSIFIPVAFSITVAILCRVIFSVQRSVAPIDRKRDLWHPLIGVALAGTIALYTVGKSIPDPGAFSQTYDAVFHLNAIQFILDGGSASPFDLNMSAPESRGFYPSLWHAFVSLIVQLSGSSITVATNSAIFFVLVTGWSVGAIGFVRAVIGTGINATLVAAIVASVFPSFPFSFVSYGVLYPNFLSMLFLPFLLIGMMKAAKIPMAVRTDVLPKGAHTLLLFGSFGAAVLAHPNAAHVTYLISLPFIIFGVCRTFASRSGTSRKFAALLSLIIMLVLGGALWWLGQTSSNPWGGSQGPFGALIEGFGMNPRFEGHNWVVFFFLLLGLLVAVKRQHLRPLVLILIVLMGFYVIAEGFPPSDLRKFILAPWYSDPWRLAGLLPLAMIPLVAIGIQLTTKVLTPAFNRFLKRWIPSRNRVIRLGNTVILMFGLALIGTSLHGVSGKLDESYRSVDDDARVISPDERAILERIETHVPEDAVILTNPWNGGALVYAATGRDVLIPHLGGSYPEEFYTAMDGITYGSASACDMAENLNAKYVLDFGTRYVFREPARMQPELGSISGIRYAPALTEIDRSGDAVLYKITGCD